MQRSTRGRVAAAVVSAALTVVFRIAPAAAADTPSAHTPAPVSFRNDVVPLLTKAGCNAGACHAKAIVGQNGFRLSLLGFEPGDDYEHVVNESRGRRVSVAAPDESLVLLKATGRVPHRGGVRIVPGSQDEALLRRWIAEGARRELPAEPSIVRLEVDPAEQAVGMGGSFGLSVTAHYSDGSHRDVTSTALFEPSDRGRLTVDGSGRGHVQRVAGRAAVMVRYQGLVSASTVSIPAGPAVAVPEPRTLIDRHVFENLAHLGIPPSPPCDDATFIRRATLDTTGSLPRVETVRAFLADTTPDKRDRLVESLLASSGYADHFANKWTASSRIGATTRPTSCPTSRSTPGFATDSWPTSRTTASSANCSAPPATSSATRRWPGTSG